MKLLFYSILITLVSLSCKKEGCTDPKSIDFSEDAKKNDGSCTYQTTVMFWLDESDVPNYESNGVSELNVYVNDELKTVVPVANSLASKPFCGTDNDFSKSYTFNMGKESSRSYTYAIIGDDGETWKSGSWSGTGNGCISIDI